ncbi:hypothetical protein TWF718_006726 [Orbilia javanica]|uniref:Uncharacterized protein n=1 Tax=Orbilia javanica TaxID=47235 RepID=A0AAN8RHX5_9PEZI
MGAGQSLHVSQIQSYSKLLMPCQRRSTTEAAITLPNRILGRLAQTPSAADIEIYKYHMVDLYPEYIRLRVDTD